MAEELREKREEGERKKGVAPTHLFVVLEPMVSLASSINQTQPATPLAVKLTKLVI
jgi:hypothetical protein